MVYFRGKTTYFYRVADYWDMDDYINLYSWSLTLDYLKQHIKNNSECRELFITKMQISKKPKKDIDKIIDKTVSKWDLETAQEFFEEKLYIEEEEILID